MLSLLTSISAMAVLAVVVGLLIYMDSVDMPLKDQITVMIPVTVLLIGGFLIGLSVVV